MKLSQLLLWAAWVKPTTQYGRMTATDYAVLFFLASNYDDAKGYASLYMCDIQERFDWMAGDPSSGLDQAARSIAKLKEVKLIDFKKVSNKYRFTFNTERNRTDG